MELFRFHRTIHQIAEDYKKTNIDAHMTALVNHLTSLAANPGNAQIGQAYKEHLESLRQALIQSNLNAAEGDLAETLMKHKLQGYIGNELFMKVIDLLEQNQLTPNLAAPEIEKLRAETSKRLSLVIAIETAFTELEVDYWMLEDGETEMLIHLPMA